MRYIADFNAQAWLNNYAFSVDPEGDTSWDCTEYLTSNYSEAEISRIIEAEDGYLNDTIREDANAPEWVRNWSGPFEISVTREG